VFLIVRVSDSMLDDITCQCLFKCMFFPLLYISFLLQLRLCKGISYAAVAAHADNSGRRKLAAMLVDHESQSSKQASFLLACEQDGNLFWGACE
jgi:hypothetical protein